MTGPANTDVQLSALPQAFMEDYRRWWAVENDCKMGADDPEYQRLCNAYEGGQHRVMVCGDAHDTTAAVRRSRANRSARSPVISPTPRPSRASHRLS